MYGCGYISESSLGECSFCRFSCIQAQISINKAFKLFKKKKKKKKKTAVVWKASLKNTHSNQWNDIQHVIVWYVFIFFCYSKLHKSSSVVNWNRPEKPDKRKPVPFKCGTSSDSSTWNFNHNFEYVYARFRWLTTVLWFNVKRQWPEPIQSNSISCPRH